VSNGARWSGGLNLALIALAFTIGFWELREITRIIGSTGSLGVSDLSRYHAYFHRIDISTLPDIVWYKGTGFYALFLVMREVGLDFEVFLFFAIFVFYFAYIKLTLTCIGPKRYLVLLCVLFGASYWLGSVLGVVLRQGIVYLVVLLAIQCGIFTTNSRLGVTLIALLALVHPIAFAFLFALVAIDTLRIPLMYVERLFALCILLYIIGFFNVTATLFRPALMSLDLFSASALGSLGAYKTGFSLAKATAFVLPFVVLKVSVTRSELSYPFRTVYLLFLYFSIFGMFVSGYPYHDRVFLFAWTVSPILYGCGLVKLCSKLTGFKKGW